MKLTISYANLMKALNTVTATFTDKAVGVDLQTIILRATETESTMCTGTFDTYCITTLDVERIEGAATVSIPSKAITTALAGYSSLHTTRVDKVVINVDDMTHAVSVEVTEVPKDENTASVEQKQPVVSVYRLQTAQVQACHVDMLNTMQKQYTYAEDEYTEVDAQLFLKYLKTALVSTTSEDIGDTPANRIAFDEKYVYVVPKYYVLLMQNQLPEVLRRVIFKRTMALFLKTYLSGVEKVKIRVEQASMIGEIIQVTVKTDESIAVMRAHSTKVKFDVTSFIELPENRVELSRAYFNDIVHRLVMLKEDVNVSVDFTAGECYFTNALTKQHIRAKSTVGNGEYHFMLNPDAISKLSLSSGIFNADSDTVWFCVAEPYAGSVTLGFTDDKGTWQTKINELPVVRGDFEWT